MAGYDGAGSLFALGLRLTKLDASGAPLTGEFNCYTTESLVSIGLNQEYSEPDAIEQKNGQGITCVYFAPPKTLLRGLIEDFIVCVPDPNILEFCVGGEVITTGGTDEVQTATITGTPTGGSFTLTYDGQTTANIAYNAIASAVQSALVALSNVSTGDVVVTGGPGPGTPYVITFGGAKGSQEQPLITASGSGLTGGTTPAVGVVETTPGAPGANVIGYRAPEVNVDATPNGIAIEAWTQAVRDNANDPTFPYFHWILGRCKLTPSEALTMNAEDALVPTLEGTIEQNANFGAGPADDIEIPTDRIYQYYRTDTIPDLTAGFVEIP